MKVILKWGDGETKTLYDVTDLGQSWHHDEYVISVEYRDGSTDTYTGKQLGVSAAQEIDGQTYMAEDNHAE